MRGAKLTAATGALAVVAMCIIALADLSTKQSTGKISPSLGTLIYG